MKNIVLFFVWILAILAATVAVRYLQAAPNDDQQLANIRIDHDIDIENQPFTIFYDVMRGTGIPAGIAQVTACSGLPNARLKVQQGATIPEAMDAFVATNPTYRWIPAGRVVNLELRGGVALLNTKIRGIQIDSTDRDIPAILQDLLRLPVARRRTAELGLTPALGQGGPSAVDEHPVPKRPLPIHIWISNVSLRDAFNTLVRTWGHTIWIYRETDCARSKT